MKVRVPLRSDDPPETRAAKIVQLLGWAGDPDLIARQTALIADVIEQYAVLDRAARAIR